MTTNTIADVPMPDADAAPVPGKSRKSVGMPDRVKIILEENDDIPPTGLFVGVNGRGYLLKPGEEIEVPQAVVEVLENAVTSAPLRDGGQQLIGYRDRMRFPFRRM